MCTKDRVHYFGEVANGMMKLNDLGKWCHDEISRMSERKTVSIHEWIVMPNHVHLLLSMSDFTEQMNTGYLRRDAFATRPKKLTEIGQGQIITGQGQATSLSLQDGIVKDDAYE